VERSVGSKDDSGDYQVTATKPNFTRPEGQKQVSILPGSCAPLRIPLAPVSTLSDASWILTVNQCATPFFISWAEYVRSAE